LSVQKIGSGLAPPGDGGMVLCVNTNSKWRKASPGELLARVVANLAGVLGLVRYPFGEASLSHDDLVRSVRALSEEGQYPGLSSDPMAGFHRGGATWVDKHPKKSGFAGLGP